MNLNIDTQIECKSLLTLISNYESDLKEDETIGVNDVISDIKSAIDKFRIESSFDFIGPMKCSYCEKEWIAILSKDVKKLECPRCHRNNYISKKGEDL